MKNIEKYLDELKEITGSDYQTAKKMGVGKSVISQIRTRKAVSDENAVKMAELLGIDPAEVLIAAAMARSEGAVKAAWESVGKRAGIAASLIMAAMLSNSQIDGITGIETVDNIHYAKSRIPR